MNRGRQVLITRAIFIAWALALAAHRLFMLTVLADVDSGSRDMGLHYILLFLDPWATLPAMLVMASFHDLTGAHILAEQSLGPAVMVATVLIDAAIIYQLWKACRGAFIKEKNKA